MFARGKRILSFLLAIILFFQLLSGCSSTLQNENSGEIQEDKIYEDWIYSSSIPEEQLQAQYIAEHLIYEEGLYEIVIGEQYICQAYLIETVITSTSEDDFVNQLPQEVLDYGIDWSKVISKFAVGTAVIVAVGVINHATHGQTVFMFGTAASIAKEAIVGGVIDAVMNVILNCNEENPPDDKVTKYAIEGFADGYMWGAISAVAFNFIFPKQLVSKNHGKLKVDNFGNAINKAGKVIGKALYDLAEDQITLIDDAGKILGFFKSNGDEILDLARAVLKPNAAFVLGLGDDAVKCFTDASGAIFRIGDDLAKNATYTLNGYIYKTDELGRIVSVTFEKLTLKPEGQARKVISSSIEEIGKGYQQVGDHRGHIIGDRFNGDNSLANIVFMNADLNLKDFKAIEDLWEDCLEDGKLVSGTIEFVYDGTSFRPGRMDVTYLIDGIKDAARFFN